MTIVLYTFGSIGPLEKRNFNAAPLVVLLFVVEKMIAHYLSNHNYRVSVNAANFEGEVFAVCHTSLCKAEYRESLRKILMPWAFAPADVLESYGSFFQVPEPVLACRSTGESSLHIRAKCLLESLLTVCVSKPNGHMRL